MLVNKRFGDVELVFQIERPYIPDPQTGELVESDKYMLTIHKGSLSWFSGGVLLDTETNRTGLFASPSEAVDAATKFAINCGLKE